MSTVQTASALAPFRVRSFRFQWPADLLTSWASEMEIIILGWYVLTETGSVLLLTAFASLSFLGTLLAPLYGVIGDRIGHRTLLYLLRTSYATLAAALMLLGLGEALSPVAVFIVAALAGLVRPADQMTRNALIGETMGAHNLMSAMGMSRATQDSARVAGALAGAGLFAALGFGPAYVFVTGFYLVGLGLTFGIAKAPAGATPHAARASHWRDLKDGLIYVWTTPKLLALMWLAFLVNLAAYPINGLLPYVAKQIYGLDQTGLGYLVASYAGGALIGSLAMAATGWPRRPMRPMVFGTLAWFVGFLVFGHLRGADVGAPVLFMIGLAQSVAMISMAVALLNTASPVFRGRVMGVRMLAVYGMAPGLMASGALVGHIGFATTVSAFCVIGLFFTAVIAIRWRGALWNE